MFGNPYCEYNVFYINTLYTIFALRVYEALIYV